MINCPKCNESLGDDIRICPFCRHELTDEERLLIEKAKHEEARELSREEAARTEKAAVARLKFWLLLAGILILTMIAMIILNSLELYMAGVIVFVAGLVSSFLIAAFMVLVKKVNNCPHCGGFLFRNWGTNCQWCGKQIR